MLCLARYRAPYPACILASDVLVECSLAVLRGRMVMHSCGVSHLQSCLHPHAELWHARVVQAEGTNASSIADAERGCSAGSKPAREQQETRRARPRWSLTLTGPWTGSCSTGGLARRQMQHRVLPESSRAPRAACSAATRPSGCASPDQLVGSLVVARSVQIPGMLATFDCERQLFCWLSHALANESAPHAQGLSIIT